MTAVAGDYSLADGDVTFNPGETKKEVTVFILDDKIVEASESFKAKLTGDSNAVVVAPGEATVFILDNDGVFSLLFLLPKFYRRPDNLGFFVMLR